MRNIEPYKGDAMALYDAIIEAKKDVKDRPGILTAIRPRIQGLYATYERCKTNLEAMSPAGRFSKREREALHHCYDTETAPLLEMKRDVLNSIPPEINKCLYCGIGEIGPNDKKSTGEWDHYLPRRNSSAPEKGFPEFAVHPLNLIPSCGVCNGYKGEQWKEGSQRLLINVYYDTIDQRVPLVEARFESVRQEPSASFYFADVPQIREPFGWFFMRHFRKLNLLSRYAWASRSEISRARRSAARRPPRGGPEDLAMELGETAEQEGQDLGVNHWKAAFYRAAARSPDFIHYCIHGVMPAQGDPRANKQAEGSAEGRGT